MVLLIDDEVVSAGVSAAEAVRWMGEAVDAHHRGALLAPPRVEADLGAGRLVFTVGRLRGEWFGYRSYDTLAGGGQVVVVHDEASGRVRAVSTGTELGLRRVAGIGGAAADALAPRAAAVAAVIGTGRQAWFQLWALAAVRDLREVRVFSRDLARRSAFAARAAKELRLACHPSGDARAAVQGAQIVVLATDSSSPVIDAAWLPDGCYVTTLGPKQQGRAEFGLDLPAAASLLVTDSPAQIDAYHPPNVLAGTPHRDRLVSLGAVRAGDVGRPGPGAVTVFLSVGLAGTEVFLLDRLARGRSGGGPAAGSQGDDGAGQSRRHAGVHRLDGSL